jgi:signal transduction histidine kinase
MFRIFLFSLVVILVGCKQKQPQDKILKEIDYIQEHTLKLSDSNQVKPFLIKGLNLVEQISNDTTKINYKRKMTCQYYNHKMFNTYYDLTRENLAVALKLNDSNYISKLYLDVGDFYYNTEIDSAYFYYRKALPYFRKVNKHYISTQFSIARLLSKENLHMESEAILYQNLQHAIIQGENETLSSIYNILAINYTNTLQFDLAIDALKQSKSYIDKIEIEYKPHSKSILKTRNYTNLGWTYTQKKDFSNAKKYFDLGLKEVKICKENYNKTYLLINIQKLNNAQNKLIDKESCEEVLKLSLENDIQENIVNAKHYLGLVAFQKNDNKTAFKHINEGIVLAKTHRLNEILLEIYTSLSLYDPTNEKKWLRNIIDLKNEMINIERQTRNKFAKITYETEVVHQKNIELTQKISKYLIYGGIFTLFILFVFILFRIRTNNKILKMDQEQKENNLTIFNLLVAQQDMLEKGKSMEKSRLSKELHDGIASQIYIMRFLTELNLNKDAMPKIEVEKLHKNLENLENNVRTVAHDLANVTIIQNKLYHLIEELIKTYNDNSNYLIELTHNENYEESNITNLLKVNLYRIIQEAIKNIDKYSNAENVYISLNIDEKNILTLTIKDDGKGFNINQTKKGIGLKNMEERTLEFNGEFKLNSIPNHGVTITCTFELKSLG